MVLNGLVLERPVQHDPERAVFVVHAHQHHRAEEVLVGQGQAGNQEFAGERFGHALIMAELPPGATRCGRKWDKTCPGSCVRAVYSRTPEMEDFRCGYW